MPDLSSVPLQSPELNYAQASVALSCLTPHILDPTVHDRVYNS